MALKALDIYKLLPKKNCKECGDPTCLTFAMKLASGKADPDKCPYLDPQAKEVLGSSTKPPVKPMRIGVGERSFRIGEESCLYRHEKTFYHAPGFFLALKDSSGESQISTIANRVEKDLLVRAGQDLRLNGVAIISDSKNPETFGSVVKKVEELVSLPEILISNDPKIVEAGLTYCGSYHPVIHAATRENYPEMCRLALKFGCRLIISEGDITKIPELVNECVKIGVPDLILDPCVDNLSDCLKKFTVIRKKAVTREDASLGYRLYLDTGRFKDRSGSLYLGILKYASLIVIHDLPEPVEKAALTLRQGIYTDPQRPIQMEPGLYKIGEPGKDSPVFMTVNFSLTFFTLQGYLESSGVSCYMLIVDTEGLSVLTAVAAGKLTDTLVNETLKKADLANIVSHHTLIIPGYAAPISGKLEDETGWKILVGPRDAAEVGTFLESLQSGETK